MSRTKDKIKLEHYTMPTVDGAPVVESGSNSDGEWTRWADGTQLCTASANIGQVTTTSGSLYSTSELSIPSPLAFIDNPSSYAHDLTSSLIWGLSFYRTATAEFSLRLFCYTSITSDRTIQVSAFGYWK